MRNAIKDWLAYLTGYQRSSDPDPSFGYCPQCGAGNDKNKVEPCPRCAQINGWQEKYEKLSADLDRMRSDHLDFTKKTETTIKRLVEDAKKIDNNRKKWKQRALSLVGQLARYDDARLPEGSETWGSEE